MNYKHCKLFTSSVFLSLFLSGCFSTDGLFSSDEAEQNIAEEAQTTEQLVSSDTAATTDNTETLAETIVDPDLELVNALNAQENKFVFSKKAITQSQKVFMVEALEALQQQNYESGLLSVDNALKLGELNSNSYVVQADLYLALEQNDKAISSLEKALSINPHNAKAANRLAAQMREQGRFDEALALYTQAIESVPNHMVSYRNRGVLNDLYRGDKSAALDDYQVYSAFLNVAHGNSDDKAKKKQIKLVKRWLIDVERQLDAVARNASND